MDASISVALVTGASSILVSLAGILPRDLTSEAAHRVQSARLEDRS